MACLLLLAAGLAGLIQLAITWLPADRIAVPTGTGPVTGWRLYRGLSTANGLGIDLIAVRYALLAVAVAAGALVLLGLTMLLPIDHRPLGGAALLLSLVSLLSACWVVLRTRNLFDLAPEAVFQTAHAGWYLFLGMGLLGLAGALQALGRG